MTCEPATPAPLGTATALPPEDIPRIYVACLAAYNNGCLHGRWIDATTPDEIMAEVRTMLAASPIPGSDEWALHDHEGFEGASLSEYASFETVCALADFIAEHGRLGAKVYGYFGSVTLYHVTLVTAYNDVSGTVTNGFGGGPFFTSADDHTIDGTADQKAAAFNLEYGGVEGLTLGVWHTDFDIGEDDTDYYALYDVNDGLGLEFIHTDMYDDGHFVRLIVNYRF